MLSNTHEHTNSSFEKYRYFKLLQRTRHFSLKSDSIASSVLCIATKVGRAVGSVCQQSTSSFWNDGGT